MEQAIQADREARTDAAEFADLVDVAPLQGSELPLFVTPKPGQLGTMPDFLKWVEDYKDEIDRLILQRGAIVLRAFPLRTATDFNDFVSLFPAYGRGYVGGRSPRASVVGKVMESTRYAPELKLPLHQEMAYLRDYPARLAFFSLKPAAEGGETIIGDMREFTRRMPADLAAKLEALGIRGVRNYAAAGKSQQSVQNPDSKAWDESFQTDDVAEVEKVCTEMGLTPVWDEDGRLAVVNHLDAFAIHPATGERVYRNIIHSHYGYKDQQGKEPRKDGLESGTTFGDGTEISRERANELLNLLDDVTISWKWQAGDLMLLDNLLVAHGRNPFVGERETLVALLD